MKYHVNDWVLIGSGNKAHWLGQGYDGLVIRCNQKFVHPGTKEVCINDIEQENMRDGSNCKKCKTCLRIANKFKEK